MEESLSSEVREASLLCSILRSVHLPRVEQSRSRMRYTRVCASRIEVS